MKPQVVFVDEPNVLAGIRRTMRRRSQDWDIHLVDNVAEALDLLGSLSVDVLITDIGTPDVDGAALLEQARLRWPTTARVVLSGHADRDAILAAAGPTQQFLYKPCDPEHLVQVVSTVVDTVRLMDDPHLRALLGAQNNLPKPPGISSELTNLISIPGTTARDVAQLIERDVASCAEVLKLVNSSFFGLTNEITSIERAVALLGLDVIQALVLAGSLFAAEQVLPPGLDVQAISDHGLRAYLRIRRIAQLEGWDRPTVTQLGLAALLHDVGLLVLATCDPKGWDAYRSSPADSSPAQRQIDAFGYTAGRTSAYLLGLWGFSGPVVAALVNQPLDLDDPNTLATASPAELLVAYVHRDDAAPLAPDTAPKGYLDADRVARWAAV